MSHPRSKGASISTPMPGMELHQSTPASLGKEMTENSSPRKLQLRSLRRQSGAAAVELAIILPLVVTLLLGIIDAGFILYTYQDMVQAAREGVRLRAIEALHVAEANSIAKAGAEGYFESRHPELSSSLNVSISGSGDSSAWVSVRLPLADASYSGIYPGNITARVEMDYVNCPPWCK